MSAIAMTNINNEKYKIMNNEAKLFTAHKLNTNITAYTLSDSPDNKGRSPRGPAPRRRTPDAALSAVVQA